MPPVAVRPLDEPLHIVVVAPALMVGSGFTVTSRLAWPVQPETVPVIVYVVVVVGLAVTLAPVVADRPVAGAHV